MNKNLTGGAIINYGPTLPPDATSYDGAIFYKTAGTDQGMYIFGYTADANGAVAGDQSTQGWTQVQSPGLYVSKTGDVISGALGIIVPGGNNDPYGRLSVTMPNDANSYGYLGFTRQGQVGWSMGIDASNRLFFGNGSGTLNNVANRYFTFAQDGTIQSNGNTVWHAGNDGAGSGLDADLLDGQSSAFYQNAGNISTGTLAEARLPFMPVQQGGSSKLSISWTNPQLSVQVDSTNFGTTWPINISGISERATAARYLYQAGNVNGTAMIFNWAGQTGTPTWLWGGHDGVNHYVYSPGSLTVGNAQRVRHFGNANGVAMAFHWESRTGQPTYLWGGTEPGTDMYVYNPSNFSVAYAGTAGAVAWGNVTSRPTALSAFTNDTGFVTGAATSNAYLSRAVDVWATSSDGAQRFHFSSGGNTGYMAAANHQWYNSGGVGTMYLTPGGDLVASGNVTALSDRRLKKDISAIQDPLAKLAGLTGVTFTRVENGARATGLIAQDVQAVLPEAVVEGDDGMLSVAYGNLVGLLVESVKELSGQLESVREELRALREGANGN